MQQAAPAVLQQSLPLTQHAAACVLQQAALPLSQHACFAAQHAACFPVTQQAASFLSQQALPLVVQQAAACPLQQAFFGSEQQALLLTQQAAGFAAASTAQQLLAAALAGAACFTQQAAFGTALGAGPAAANPNANRPNPAADNTDETTRNMGLSPDPHRGPMNVARARERWLNGPVRPTRRARARAVASGRRRAGAAWREVASPRGRDLFARLRPANEWDGRQLNNPAGDDDRSQIGCGLGRDCGRFCLLLIGRATAAHSPGSPRCVDLTAAGLRRNKCFPTTLAALATGARSRRLRGQSEIAVVSPGAGLVGRRTRTLGRARHRRPTHSCCEQEQSQRDSAPFSYSVVLHLKAA